MFFGGEIHRFGHSSYSMEYFINTHNTYCKELSFNFPEHQNFLKSIKKSDEKIEKIWNIFENFDIFQKSQKFRKFRKSGILIFNTISNGTFSKIFSKFSDFLKNPKISKIFQIFSIFSSIFLWNSKIFDVLESWSSALYNKYYVYLWNIPLSTRYVQIYVFFTKKNKFSLN